MPAQRLASQGQRLEAYKAAFASHQRNMAGLNQLQDALDGQYEHNFTNGLGGYYRTDDVSFDPASLQGNWRRIEPFGP